MKKTWIIVIAIVVLIALYSLVAYNGLVSMNEAVVAQWQQVETQYQRRFDLIPNLVASVKGAMQQETAVFTALAEARTRYSGAQSVSEKAAAATQVESALARLLVVVENYPTLRSIDTVQSLMTQIEGTENRISVERQRYNEAVRGFNTAIKRFPKSIVASVFGFEAINYFESAAGAENAPQVDLTQ
jgi:LemA protein